MIPDIWIPGPSETTKFKVRSPQVVFRTPLNGEITASFDLEHVLHDTNSETPLGFSKVLDERVYKSLNTIMGESVTIHTGKEISCAEIAEALHLFFIRWYEEHEAKKAALDSEPE